MKSKIIVDYKLLPFLKCNISQQEGPEFHLQVFQRGVESLSMWVFSKSSSFLP